MSKKKITKRERDSMLSSLLIAGGVWFVISPMKDFISNTFGTFWSFVIGGGLILIALWRFDVI